MYFSIIFYLKIVSKMWSRYHQIISFIIDYIHIQVIVILSSIIICCLFDKKRVKSVEYDIKSGIYVGVTTARGTAFYLIQSMKIFKENYFILISTVAVQCAHVDIYVKIGNNFCILNGSKCQSKWSKVLLISSKALLICWPSSQTKNNTPNT